MHCIPLAIITIKIWPKMTLPFTPTRPLPISDESTSVEISFPLIKSNDGSIEHCGPVAVLTLCSPQKLNALTMEDMQSLWTFLEWIEEQPQISITVLTGKGRFFSAGADVADPARSKMIPEEIKKLPKDHIKHIIGSRTQIQGRVYSSNGMVVRMMYNHSKLLVAAMNGPVVGIMAAVVALCDLIYTYDNFYLLTPFSQIALVAEAGSSITFPRKMGLGKAQQALIEGKKMTAKELEDSGFISRIFPSPPTPSNADKKTYTAPILQDVLHHIGDRLLPPNVDMFAVLNTKRILRETAYMNKNIYEAGMEELLGAEAVFRAGRPQEKFEKLAKGGRHKL